MESNAFLHITGSKFPMRDYLVLLLLGLWLKRSIMAGLWIRGNCLPCDKQEMKRRKDRDPKIPFEDMAQWT